MMTKKKKKPSPTVPVLGQRIKPPNTETGHKSTNNDRPVFSFHHHGKDYCITLCNTTQKASFAGRLYELSQKTWGELTISWRKGTGSEVIAHSAIRVGLPSVVTPDVDLLSFRCDADGRIVGFRDNEVFHIIWIDFKKSLYDHGG